MVSYLQISFMMGRFVSTPILEYLKQDELMLLIYSSICTVFTVRCRVHAIFVVSAY